MVPKENKGKIVIVDGNVSVTKFLQLKLESAGYDVTVIHDGQQAMAAAPGLKADLIALASHLLEGTRELVSGLRKAIGCPVLVYGLGGYSEEETRHLEADHWIERFYEPDEFLKAVKTLLEKKPECGK